MYAICNFKKIVFKLGNFSFYFIFPLTFFDYTDFLLSRLTSSPISPDNRGSNVKGIKEGGPQLDFIKKKLFCDKKESA